MRVLGFAVGVDSVFLEVKVPYNPVQIGKVLSMYRRPGRKDWTVNDSRCGGKGKILEIYSLIDKLEKQRRIV